MMTLVGIIFLGTVSKDFAKNGQSEISLNGTVYDYSVDHISIKKEGILHIYQYLMVANNIKLCLILFKNIYWIINLPS